MILPKLLPKIAPARGRGANESCSQQVLLADIGVNDILLGRGTGPNQNQGNVRFRKTVHEQEELLKVRGISLSRNDIALKILSVIKERRGRFLRKIRLPKKSKRSPAKDVFYVVDDSQALQKIKQALRYQKKGNDLSYSDDRIIYAAVSEEAQNGEDNKNKATPGMYGCSSDPIVVRGTTADSKDRFGGAGKTLPPSVAAMPSFLHDARNKGTMLFPPKTERSKGASNCCSETSSNFHGDDDSLVAKDCECVLSQIAKTSTIPVAPTSEISVQQGEKTAICSPPTAQKAPTHPRTTSIVSTLQQGATNSALDAQHDQHDYDRNILRLLARSQQGHGAPLHPSGGHSNNDGTIMNVMMGTLVNKFLTSDIDIVRRNDVVTAWLLQQQQHPQQHHHHQGQSLRSGQVKTMNDTTTTRSSNMLLDTCNALLSLKDTRADTTIC